MLANETTSVKLKKIITGLSGEPLVFFWSFYIRRFKVFVLLGKGEGED